MTYLTIIPLNLWLNMQASYFERSMDGYIYDI